MVYHMGEVDKRGKLDEEFFSYQVTKDERVLLYWHDKLVKTLAGKQAKTFLAKIDAADSEKDAQLILAKATGNFKHGNEREGKQSKK